MTMALVTHGPRLADPAAVGHKFARQSVLRGEGFPVPEFFCVPAEEFDAALDAACAADAAACSVVDVAVWAQRQRSALLERGVPSGLAARIEAEFDRLVGPSGLVAVRACVVPCAGVVPATGEDGAEDPFAGLSDSFLYVPRADVVRRVAQCWASAFNPHAVRYRRRRGVDPAAARVAVGVQRMIDGRRSFVAFTRDPRDGHDLRVVAAAYGIGEGVVQERADVDHFFLDPATGSVEAAVVPKAHRVGLDPDRPADGPVLLSVPASLRLGPVLTDAEVRRICALADRVERHFGGPQDVEGTLTADGELHLVQARPMVLPARPAAGPGVIWTNHNLTESFPGVTCMLTFSQACQFYELGFADFYRRMGVPARVLHDHAADLRRMIGRVDGRVYYRLDAWYRLHGRLPWFAMLRPDWQRSLGLSGDELADAPPMPRRRWLWRSVRAVPRLAAGLVALPARVRGFLRWWDAFAATNGALDGCDAEELAARHRRLWSAFGARWAITLVNSYYLLITLTVVRFLLRRWADPGLLPALLSGGRENRSLAALRSALGLAEAIRRDPALRAELGKAHDHDLYRRIADGRYGPGIAAALREHLRRYGDRTVHDLKLEVRTPRQEPWMVLAMVRPLVAQGATVAASRADERRGRRDGSARLRAACPSRARRAVLVALLAALRWFIRVREDTRFCRSQLYGLSRDILWRLGEELVRRDRLDAAGDVTHLTVGEVLGAVDGTLGETDLRALAALRRGELEASARRDAPPAYLRSDAATRPAAATRSGAAARSGAVARSGAATPPVAATRPGAAARPAASRPVAPPDGPGRTLHGLGSSSGVVRGLARVLLDPTADADECRDRILVARETDPGWLYLMMAARGIVVERGSLLSHTAITGRLLGIPTVVAVPGATTAIPDNALIELDGATGTVRLIAAGDALGEAA